ncbi:hypothetical protein Tco_0652466 [Tanacetum coccineum]|uniref:Retrotransposon gag domain-containing protein n=1 Tax=Tanacetum coccineum TaxID=301880 RepID=A0ABQ4WXQ9_9ASTR
MAPNTRSVIGSIPNSSQGGTSGNNLVDDNDRQLLGELVDERMSRLERALEGLSSQVTGLAVQNKHLGNVNRGNQLQHTRLAKIEFPKFFSEGVRGWVFRCEQFFNLDQATDEEKEVYKQAVLARFGNVFNDPMYELKNLKYETSTKEYEDPFDDLLSRVEINEDHVISLFMGGLPTKIAMGEATLNAVKRKNRTSFNGGIMGRYNSGHKCSGQLYSLTVLPEEEMETKEFLDVDESLVDLDNP